MDAFKQLQESALTQLPETFMRYLSKPAVILRRDLMFMVMAPTFAAAAAIAIDFGQINAFQAQAPPAVEKIVDMDSELLRTQDLASVSPDVLSPDERQKVEYISEIVALKDLAQTQFWEASNARNDVLATKSSIEWAKEVLEANSDMDDSTREGIERGLKAEIKELGRQMAEFRAKKKSYMATQKRLVSLGASINNVGLEILVDVDKPEFLSQDDKKKAPRV